MFKKAQWKNITITLKDLTIMKIQRLTTERLQRKCYKLKYLALKNFFQSCLKILQGMDFHSHHQDGGIQNLTIYPQYKM